MSCPGHALMPPMPDCSPLAWSNPGGGLFYKHTSLPCANAHRSQYHVPEYFSQTNGATFCSPVLVQYVLLPSFFSVLWALDGHPSLKTFTLFSCTKKYGVFLCSFILRFLTLLCLSSTLNQVLLY